MALGHWASDYLDGGQSNAGGGSAGGVMVVTIQALPAPQNGYSIDHTVEEMQEAFSSGKAIVGRDFGAYPGMPAYALTLEQVVMGDSGGVVFVRWTASSNDASELTGLYMRRYLCRADGTVSASTLSKSF